MQLDSHPFFRKIIVPWYDSNISCGILIAVMLGVGLFGGIGLWTALSDSRFYSYRWIPLILIALAFAVIGSVGVRLIKRSSRRPPL